MNLPTKFEVPKSTRYGNIKGVAKCKKLGGLGRLGVTQTYWQFHYLIQPMRLPDRL